MVNANDKKIKDLLAAVEKQRKDLGAKPKSNWKTNGVLQGSEVTGIPVGRDTNINTIRSTEVCVALAAKLLEQKGFTKQACDFLGVKDDIRRAKWIDDTLEDLKVRAEQLKWEAKKDRLKATEKQLKDLRSSDAKTEDALAGIAESLK